MEPPDTHQEFLRLFLSVQQSIFAFIRASGFGLTDAEDILQDVSVELWKSFEAYDRSKPFAAWAVAITRNLMWKQRRYEAVRRKNTVSSEAIAEIADFAAAALESKNEHANEQRNYLERCLERLSPNLREVLRLRYEAGLELVGVARRIGKSYEATNMLLSRTRKQLMNCVTRQMSEANL